MLRFKRIPRFVAQQVVIVPFPSIMLCILPSEIGLCGDCNAAGAIDHVYLEEEATVDTTFKKITGDVLQSPSIPPKEKWNVMVSFHLLPFSLCF